MPSAKILVVEDDKDIRYVYEFILKQAGYDVKSATNGEEALHTLPLHLPQLVLLDIFMPIMDGRAFMEQLDPKYLDTMRIVVCSNTSDEEVLNAMTELGASQIVMKATLDPKGLTDLAASYLS
jgi:CheY-like chemotaxis protein